EAEHRAGHAEACGLGDLGHVVAFLPAGVVWVATGDLHDVGAELGEEALQLGHALDLQRPAAHADGERFEGHGSSPKTWVQGAGSITQPTGPSSAASRSRVSWNVWTCSAFSSATSFGPVHSTARPEVCASSIT